jgi:hypothetical protein
LSKERAGWRKDFLAQSLWKEGFILRINSSGMKDRNDIKNVADNGRAQMSPSMIEKIFLTGVEKTAFYSLIRIHSERED